MIEEQAHVLAIAPGRAWVQTVRRSACGSCGTSSACGTATVAKLFGERTNHLEVVDRIGVAVGDQVVIGISDGTLTRASLLAYVLPLVALMLAAFAARSAGMSEEAGALIGILGLCTGLWVTGRLARGAPGRGDFSRCFCAGLPVPRPASWDCEGSADRASSGFQPAGAELRPSGVNER